MSTTHAGRVVRDPNVTPLIDVMLVLLIIFMIVTPMIESGIAVELPTAEHLDPEQRELPLTISIEAGGEIHFRRSVVSLDVLQREMTALYAGTPQLRIVVEADRRVRFQRINRVLERLQIAGGRNVAFVATEPR